MKATTSLNPAHEKQFGIFIGLYNRLNGTKLTVRSASKNSVLVSLFESTQLTLGQVHTLSLAQDEVACQANSTKSRSYSLLDMPGVDGNIYYLLKRSTSLSRADIALALNMRLQTVCGAVKRLIDNGLVVVNGEKLDTQTNRHVETLTNK